jgi:hypothetical protein
VVLFAFSSTVFVFVMSLILGYSFSSYTELEIVFSDLIYLLAYFVKLLGFFSFCLFLGILVKRSAFALGFLLIWFLVEKISYLTLKFDIFNRDPRVDQVYAFMPLESMSNLIIEPFSRLSIIKNIQSAVGEKGIKDYDVHFTSILIVLLWTAIFIFLSYKIIKKRDL